MGFRWDFAGKWDFQGKVARFVRLARVSPLNSNNLIILKTLPNYKLLNDTHQTIPCAPDPIGLRFW